MANVPEIVGLENGKLLIQYRDWKSYLTTYFKTFPYLTKYHHFDFSSNYPSGQVNLKEFEDSAIETKNMIIDVEKLPP